MYVRLPFYLFIYLFDDIPLKLSSPPQLCPYLNPMEETGPDFTAMFGMVGMVRMVIFNGNQIYFQFHGKRLNPAP